MLISGFSMIKNASKLYYPIKEAVMSILPIVDEFVIAIGDCDEGDNTRELIESIGSDKIKIIDTVWDLEKYPNGMENAHQTDIAKKACSGEWLFYLQADEVVHEKYLDTIVNACKKYKDDKNIEGFLFKYKHFWGDYDHYHISHGWYPKEIRIIRNNPEIHSWESAQSFRRIPNFDEINYRQQEGTYKLKVIEIDAYIYHYGWVRPPQYMQAKKQALDTVHKGSKKVAEIYKNAPKEFDYGPLNKLAVFKESHPKVMKKWIEKFDWKDKLQYSGKPNPYRKKHKHEKLKYKILTFVEQKILGGKQLGGFRNYILLKKEK
ncbi:hypothetical protein EV215_1165 [Hypnocyclicus thermotrophus]|uniref:Glycosyltransferase involved in cell wall biosynthesis n=1 Tax=Hypnocyclicus thermotrophus TaxID=1627895 RepID=A0AA46I5T7_9FUSO|nr:hypothetical protein [Hypnocyclicus thermotrophus]TDT70614.1 hypothetical protein EV215_1165 [Hypnocyclicus thermotrophus]